MLQVNTANASRSALRTLALALLAASLITGAGCEFLDEVPDDSSVYRLKSNEDALMQIYDARLERWPVPFDIMNVATSYGTTHVIASGPTG